jgi:hypothetical protein
MPIASWYYKTQGQRIHWVLPKTFAPFTKIESLLRLQPMTANVTLVNHHIQFLFGGQPYKFDPADFGIGGDFINIGFRSHPDKFIPYFYAEEYGLGVDKDFVLELGEVEPTDEVLCTEHLQQQLPHAKIFDCSQDVLTNARRMKSARERHCFHSGMGHIMYFANVYFDLWVQQHPHHLYFPDHNKFKMHYL